MLLVYKDKLIAVSKQACKVYLQGYEISAPSIAKAKHYIDQDKTGKLIVKTAIRGN